VPFTVSHAAAVLPLYRYSKHKLPLSALMIGSMAPDFGYFFSHGASREFTHSFPSLLTFSLPAGLFIWIFYVAVLEKATITLLPDRWHTRFAHTDAITPGLLMRAALAVVLGGLTHILWDACTHRATFVTDAFPFLLGFTPGIGWLPIYHFLHGLSSVVGLGVLGMWLQSLHRQPARSQIRPYDVSERARMGALWFMLAGALLVAFIDWLPYRLSPYDAQLFSVAVGAMSGFFIAWCAVALWMLHRARKAKRAARSN
jgi:hypothetical protein